MYYNGKDFKNLEEYLEEKKREYIFRHGVDADWDESEEIIWAIQDYLSSMGEFSDEDLKYLEDTNPEFIGLAEDII